MDECHDERVTKDAHSIACARLRAFARLCTHLRAFASTFLLSLHKCTEVLDRMTIAPCASAQNTIVGVTIVPCTSAKDHASMSNISYTHMHRKRFLRKSNVPFEIAQKMFSAHVQRTFRNCAESIFRASPAYLTQLRRKRSRMSVVPCMTAQNVSYASSSFLYKAYTRHFLRTCTRHTIGISFVPVQNIHYAFSSYLYVMYYVSSSYLILSHTRFLAHVHHNSKVQKSCARAHRI